MPATVPYRFDALPRMSRDQVALQQSMARHLAYAPLPTVLREQLASSLSTLLKETVEISAAECAATGREGLAALLPAPGCFVVLAAAPTTHKLVVDIDANLAAGCIERVLGGSGASERYARAFTQVEQGVLSFIVLRLLSLVQGAWVTGRELSLTLERFVSTFAELGSHLPEHGGIHLLTFRLALGGRQGYARVLLPDGLLSEHFGCTLPQSGQTPAELNSMRRSLEAIGDREVTAYLHGATIELAANELANVEAGDIIILENHGLQRTQDGIIGEIFVAFGNCKNGGLKAQLFTDASQPDQARLRVLSFVIQEHPLERDATMSDEQDPADASAPAAAEDNLEQTEHLLRDIDAPVVVELGRLKLSTAQVVRLRAGQILRLTRGANDPVDLVVGGKVFARGELIDIEGEMGIKLTHVTG